MAAIKTVSHETKTAHQLLKLLLLLPPAGCSCCCFWLVASLFVGVRVCVAVRVCVCVCACLFAFQLKLPLTAWNIRFLFNLALLHSIFRATQTHTVAHTHTVAYCAHAVCPVSTLVKCFLILLNFNDTWKRNVLTKGDACLAFFIWPQSPSPHTPSSLPLSEGEKRN